LAVAVRSARMGEVRLDLSNKRYIAVVQCDIVMQRCSGFFCERAFHNRSGGFGIYGSGQPLRLAAMTCGGCCGLAIHRKLGDLLRMAKKKDGIGRDQVVVHLASCITKDNYHGPECPHLDFLKQLIGAKLGLDIVADTHISDLSEKRRAQGLYRG
jgi:predicted metal-binding protein